ncbi:MAG: hypothetical protein M1833_005991 [Piccolia ochrophora]|nr:MAG: hypothetical protein M1833_005991 [Piccolia ochrophora]
MRTGIRCLTATTSAIKARALYIEIADYVRTRPRVSLRPNNQHALTRSLSRRVIHTTANLRQVQPRPSSQLDAFQSFKDTLTFPRETHSLRELTGPGAPVEQEVVLHGYLGERVDLSKKLYFVPLLNKTLDCTIQIISSASTSEDAISAHEQLKSIEANSPVTITGILKPRAASKPDASNIHRIKDHEIHLEGVRSLNRFPKDIIAKEETRFTPEQRHLQVRTDKAIRNALVFRGQAARLCRDELHQHGFVEIETPLLFKSTPEGAREFLVPTRRKGLAYALPQSPQQYKQILMASGIAKYYQLAKCFRDEDLRADRQPEFTQLDLELSFATGEDVIRHVTNVIRRLWKDLLGVDIPRDIPRMTYDEAMSAYGSDKPDLRLTSKIVNLSHLLPADLVGKISPLTTPIVEIIKLHISDDSRETRNFVAGFMDSSQATVFTENPNGAPGIFIIDSRKPLQGLQPFGFEAAEHLEEYFELSDGDLLVLQARPQETHTGSSTALGNLRLALHKAAVAQGLLTPPTGFEFLWVTDFPLFSPSTTTEPGQGGSAGLASTHHPFTAPARPEDVELLLTDPTKVRGEHYDLVVNGVELGGGSRRIHNSKVQKFVLEQVLKMPEQRLREFSHLLEVLRAGCPPHAGIALGFDRLVAVMLGRDSVRDVMAFPKTGRGDDPLVNSPSAMDTDVLETYHLKLKEDS